MLAKDEIIKAIENMPDEASYDDVIDAIIDMQTMEKITRGMNEVEAGKTIPADEVFRKLGMR